MFAALAYDSVYMVAKASEGAKTSIDIANNLAKSFNFARLLAISIDVLAPSDAFATI